MDISSVLGNISESKFFEEYWEKQPCVLSRPLKVNTLPFEGVLTMDDLNELLSTTRLRSDECKVAYDGNIIPPQRYLATDRMRVMNTIVGDFIDNIKLLQLYASGSTLVFSELSSKLPKLNELKCAAESFFSATVLTNVFLSQSQSQGFSAHYDSHDVIVMQLHGSKRWTVYSNPIELPLKSQSYGRYMKPAVSSVSTILELELHEGEAIYIPRGFMHEAKTNEDVSLHLTLGIHPLVRGDFLTELLSSVVHEKAMLRKSMPRNFSDWSDTKKLDFSRDLLKTALDEVKVENVRSLYDGYRSKQECLSRFSVPNHLEQINKIDSITLASYLSKVSSQSLTVVTMDSMVAVHQGRRQLFVLPASYSELLSSIVKENVLTMDLLSHDFGEAERLTVAKKLVTSGAYQIIPRVQAEISVLNDGLISEAG